MRVLQVHEVDFPGTGGGAIVMHRLHLALRKAGVDSTILCKRKKSRGSDSVVIPRGRLSARLESHLSRITARIGLNDVHCLSTFSINKLEAYAAADLLHLHCIHGGFFNYLALPRL